jgi:hypothetical protein
MPFSYSPFLLVDGKNFINLSEIPLLIAKSLHLVACPLMPQKTQPSPLATWH